MARFRKNDFLKWAQKIKSVFCFIPHTHEGCDWADARISDMVKEFQSTHTRRMWPLSSCMMKILSMFQSTHPRKVWPGYLQSLPQPSCFNPHTHEGCDKTRHYQTIVLQVSIHTPTKGVTAVPFIHQYRQLCFNPHTHEGCDLTFVSWLTSISSFNPHTHEGCDEPSQRAPEKICVSIHTPTKGVTPQENVSWVFRQFQSTHPRRVWLSDRYILLLTEVVSIHTPTKGVTLYCYQYLICSMFQSTHPRRVWRKMRFELLEGMSFNPHTHEGCDSLSL